MVDERLAAHSLDAYEQFVEFFDEAVMAAYLQQSDRFAIETHHFEGHLSSRYASAAAAPANLSARVARSRLA